MSRLTASVLLSSLSPNYALAQQVAANDAEVYSLSITGWSWGGSRLSGSSG